MCATYLFQVLQEKQLLCCHTPMQIQNPALPRLQPAAEHEWCLAATKNHENLRIRLNSGDVMFAGVLIVWTLPVLQPNIGMSKSFIVYHRSKSCFKRFKHDLIWFEYLVSWAFQRQPLHLPGCQGAAETDSTVPGCPNQCSCSLIATLPQNGATFGKGD